MASPVGHLLLALSCTGFRERSAKPWPALVWVVIFTACWAPDFDFLPGILIGEPNRYHHGASHSLAGALLFSSAIALSFRKLTDNRVSLGRIAFLAYTSHLLGDWLTIDTRAPIGIPIFWPLNDSYFISPLLIFQDIRHGADGTGLAGFLIEVFSIANLSAIGLELVITLPVLVAVETARRRIGRGH